MYKYKPKNKKWSKLGALVAETANAVKQEGTVHSDADSIPQAKSQIQGVGTVIPELYQLALQQQNRKLKIETAAFRETYPMLPNPHDDPPSNSFAYKPKRETESVHFMPSTDLPEPMRWKQATEDQTKQTTYSLENSVENFISTMVPEEQASLRGINPTEWKNMVADRLNDVNMSADEFSRLERYYGLSLEDEETKTTFSNEKMSYGEYRAKVAQQRIDDVNAALRQYFADYQSFVNSATQDFQSIDYQNASSMRGNWSKTATELRKQADDLLSVLQNSGDIIPGDYSELLSTLSLTKQDIRSVMNVFAEQEKYYSQWESEDAYQEAMAAQKEWDDLMNFNVAAGWWEIDRLEAVLEEYKELTRLELPEAYREREAWLRNKYGSVSDLKALISEKKAYIRRAEYLQEGQKLASVTANEDFDIYNGYVSTRKDGPLWIKQGDVTYEYINSADKGVNSEAVKYFNFINPEGVYEGLLQQYDYINPIETAIYNYYYATDGKEAAEKYLDSIQEKLNYRQATGIYEPMEDNVLRELAFATTAGLDQFASGLDSLLNFKDTYIPTSAIQYASGMVREDLADNTIPAWYNFKTGQWEDEIFGNSVGQVTYDMINTTSNMLPSIIVSTAIGTANPVAGAAAGSVLLGASAAGNAYQEMLNLGYDKGQARTYSTMVGASEAGLQFLMGGIGKLGGQLTGPAVEKILQGVDNALAKAAIQFGGNILSEGLEEGLQEILTPWFKQLTTHVGEDIDWSQVAYSSLLGCLSAFLMEGSDLVVSKTSQQMQYAKTGKEIKATDGGVDTLMNSANEVKAKSSEDVQKTLNEQMDQVTQNPSARNIGRLAETVRAAGNQIKTSVGPSQDAVRTANNLENIKFNEEAVITSLMGRGPNSETAVGIADALVARLNGQKLTSAQKSYMNYALDSPTVQSVISELMKKKSNGIDSTLKNAYDEINTIGGNENGRETALWDLQNQRADGSLPGSQDQTRAAIGDGSGVPGTLGENDRTFHETLPAARRGVTSAIDVFSDDDYATVKGGSSLHQVQNTFRQEYGIECHVIKDSSWTRSSPAYSRDGVVYIREGIDLGTLSTAVPHEATHVMKQQSFQPYVDFILRTPDMLNFQSEVIQKLLDRVADHKKIDPFDASPQQLFSFYDELNAVVYGLYKSGVLDNNEFDYHEYIPGAFNDFASYIQAMDRLHEEFRNQRNASGQTKAADGGVDALMNLANEVSGVSPADMESTLTSQIDKVSQNANARNVVQPNSTVQTATNQTNTPIDPAEVTHTLRTKGISERQAGGIAEAIVARLNGQELTRPQRNLLNFALSSSAVRDTISDLMQKKTNRVDSAQSREYDGNTSEKRSENEAETIPWNLAKQTTDGSLQNLQTQAAIAEQQISEANDHAAVTEDTALNQVQKRFSDGNYEGGGESRKFNNWDDMKDAYRGTVTQFIKENKPKYSPEIKKWFDNGGSIEVQDIDGKKIWIYTSSTGISVPYIDGYINFPDEYLHPVIKSIDIGEFTGDRGKDIDKVLPILQADYGMDEIPDGYTVHHDIVNGILQLVDESIHAEFTHIGGYSIYK